MASGAMQMSKINRLEMISACAATALFGLVVSGHAMAQQNQFSFGSITFTTPSGQPLPVGGIAPGEGAAVIANVAVTVRGESVSGTDLEFSFVDPSGSPSHNFVLNVDQTANTTQNYSFTYTLPINTTAGNETVFAIPINLDPSFQASNQEASFPVLPAPAPITLDVVTVTPSTVFPGQTVTITVPVGTGNASVANDVLQFPLYYPGTPFGVSDQSTINLPPTTVTDPATGQSQPFSGVSQPANTILNYSTTYKVPSNMPLGQANLFVQAAGPGFTAFPNVQTNGGALLETGSFQVVAPPPPPAVAIGSVGINPLTIAPNQTVNFTAILIANQNPQTNQNCDPGAFPVEFSVFRPNQYQIVDGQLVNVQRGQSIDTVVCQSILAGQTATAGLSFTLPATDANGHPMPTGKYLLEVMAAPAGFGPSASDIEDYLFDVADLPAVPQNSVPELLSQSPGPSLLDYQSPFYACTRNFYVDPNGDDNNPGTLQFPWQTIGNADNLPPQPGDCINVASGTYQGHILLTNGGNAPTPNGYVVYRCEELDACHVLALSTGSPQDLWELASPANYVAIDGFEIDGNKVDGVNSIASTCVVASFDDNRFLPAPNNDTVHHAWVLNNIVHDCSLGGIGFNNSEWLYVAHNAVYDTAWTSGYQGSGIGIVAAQCIEANNPACASGSIVNGITVNNSSAALGTGTYVPSGMDLTYLPPYHVVIAFNNVFSNSVALIPTNIVACGSHTDGNGIIIDTWWNEVLSAAASNQQGAAVLVGPYPFQSLVLGNTSAFNGARGVHVFASSNVTVANNTVYGNGTDNCINAYFLGDLSQSGGQNNIWINNLSKSVLTTFDPTCGGTIPSDNGLCGNRQTPLIAGNGRGVVDSGNIYVDNLLFGGNGAFGAELFDNDASPGVFQTSLNPNVNPLLNNPMAGDFSLQRGSPAIGLGAQISINGVLMPPTPLPDAGACQSALGSPCPAPVPFAPRLAPALVSPGQ